MKKKLIVFLIIVVIIMLFIIKLSKKENIYQKPIEEMINMQEYDIIEEYINSLYVDKDVKFDIRAISNQQNEFIVKIMEYKIKENKESSSYFLLDKYENIVSTYNFIDYEKEKIEEEIKLDAIKNEKDMNMKQLTIILRDNEKPQIIEDISI